MKQRKMEYKIAFYRLLAPASSQELDGTYKERADDKGSLLVFCWYRSDEGREEAEVDKIVSSPKWALTCSLGPGCPLRFVTLIWLPCCLESVCFWRKHRWNQLEIVIAIHLKPLAWYCTSEARVLVHLIPSICCLEQHKDRFLIKRVASAWW